MAVIGLPHERLGEIAAAIIQVKEGMDCTEAEIQEFCLDLPRYKRPRKIIFADVPRNPTGKIEKPKLRERYGADRLVESATTFLNATNQRVGEIAKAARDNACKNGLLMEQEDIRSFLKRIQYEVRA